MKVIVLGASGFVGSHLIKRLEKDGHVIVAMGRQWWVHQKDLGGCDVLVNCAGQLDDLSEMVHDNLTTVGVWLEFCRNHSINRFIQVGSSAETGPFGGARSPSIHCRPSNLYEATKFAATILCRGYAKQYGMDVVVARPFSLYGFGDKPRKMLPTLWRCWVEDKPFECYRGGHDWLHIDDFVEGLMKLLVAPADLTSGRIYHFGTERSTPNEEVVNLFNQSVGKGGVTVNYHTVHRNLYDVDYWAADCEATHEALHWLPSIDLETGIYRFVSDSYFAAGSTHADL